MQRCTVEAVLSPCVSDITVISLCAWPTLLRFPVPWHTDLQNAEMPFFINRLDEVSKKEEESIDFFLLFFIEQPKPSRGTLLVLSFAGLISVSVVPPTLAGHWPIRRR